MPTEFHNRARVAFDTNMLLAIEQLKVDVFSEVEEMFGKEAMAAIPGQVLKEVQSLKEGKGNAAKAALIALEEIKRHKVKVLDVKAENTDKALEKMAKEGFFVASNDAVLRKRIKGFAGKVIYLRQGHFLKTG